MFSIKTRPRRELIFYEIPEPNYTRKVPRDQNFGATKKLPQIYARFDRNGVTSARG